MAEKKLTTEEMPTEAVDLMVQIMQNNASSAAKLSNDLRSYDEAKIMKLEQALKALRTNIRRACSGPYSPSTAYLLDLLYVEKVIVREPYGEEI